MCPVTPHTWPRGQCKVSWSLRTSGRGPGEPGTDAGQLRFIETHLDSWLLGTPGTPGIAHWSSVRIKLYKVFWVCLSVLQARVKTEMDVAHHLKVCDSVTSFRMTCKLLKESGHIHV